MGLRVWVGREERLAWRMASEAVRGDWVASIFGVAAALAVRDFWGEAVGLGPDLGVDGTGLGVFCRGCSGFGWRFWTDAGLLDGGTFFLVCLSVVNSRLMGARQSISI